MAGKGKDGDGLTYIGLRGGKRWWEARLTFTDPKTGKKKDTKAVFQADSKLLATNQRAALLEAKKKGNAIAKGDRKRFAEAIDAYIDSMTTYSSQKSWRSYARALKRRWGDHWVDSLEVRELQEYLDSLTLSASTVNGYRALLSKTFSLAVKKGWMKENIAKLLEPADRSAEREKAELEDPPKKALNTEEAVVFLAKLQELNPEVYLLVLTQFVLGCRFAEVSALQWKDVDLDSGLVRIRRGQVDGHEGRTKGKYARLPALSLRLRVDLKEHRARMAEEQWPGWETLVFPRPVGTAPRMYNQWARCTVSNWIKITQKKLGWDMPVATHIARHTMITIADELASDALIRKIAGHKDEKTRLRYTAAQKARVIDLAERLDDRLRSKEERGRAK